MTGEDMVFEMIVAANQAVLNELKVVIYRSDLVFTWPEPYEEEGGNTKIGATAIKGMTEGSQVYYYDRLDIQQAFADIGHDTVTVDVDTADIVTVLAALKAKYNLELKYTEVLNFEVDGNKVSFDIAPRCHAFIGSLVVTIVEEIPDLVTQFPNNVLNGLIPPVF